MNDQEFIAELLSHVHRANADLSQTRRSVLGVIRALEKRFPDVNIGCPDDLARPPPDTVTQLPRAVQVDEQRRA